MKVAKLVYVTLATRVIVEENADQQTIMELAVPKLSENFMNAPLENIAKIIDDNECPYELGEEYGLSIGDDVDMPEPTKLDMWNYCFTGRIDKFWQINNIIYVTVEDMEGDCWDIEAERLVEHN